MRSTGDGFLADLFWFTRMRGGSTVMTAGLRKFTPHADRPFLFTQDLYGLRMRGSTSNSRQRSEEFTRMGSTDGGSPPGPLSRLPRMRDRPLNVKDGDSRKVYRMRDQYLVDWSMRECGLPRMLGDRPRR